MSMDIVDGIIIGFLIWMAIGTLIGVYWRSKYKPLYDLAEFIMSDDYVKFVQKRLEGEEVKAIHDYIKENF